MDYPQYNEPSKMRSRETAIAKAVTLLTRDRSKITCIRQDYISELRDYYKSQGNYRRNLADSIDDAMLREWEQFHSSHVGTKRPEDLQVCYLCGPNPMNDFNVFIKNGINPNNIWAFEEDPDLYKEAVKKVKEAGVLSLKLHQGSISSYFSSMSRKFDLVYLDACGSILSTGRRNKVAHLIQSVFLSQRLASPSVLITNCAQPDVEKIDSIAPFIEIVSAYLYPKHHLDWDGAVAMEGPESVEMLFPEFVDKVRKEFSSFYDHFVTRFLMDLALIICPYVRLLIPGGIRKHVLNEEFFIPLKSKGGQFQGFTAEALKRDIYLGSTMTPLVQTFYRLSEVAKGHDVSEKAIEDWKKISNQFFPDGMEKRPLSIVECWMATQNYKRALGPSQANAIEEVYHELDRIKLVDVALGNVVSQPLLGQYTMPIHPNVSEIHRYKYRAKRNEMYLDVIPFDECRYFYEWMPAGDLFAQSFANDSRQLIFRFAMDALKKQHHYYNSELFYGCSASDCYVGPFPARKLMERQQMD